MRIGGFIPPARPVRTSFPSRDSGVETGKARAVDSMLERGLAIELRGATAEQRELLQANLGRVDRGLLLWATRQGVRLQVLQSGEELEATEALRDLTGKFEERIDPAKVQAIHEHLAPLTEQIVQEEDQERALSLRRQKRENLAELLTHNSCGAAVFTPVFAPLLAPGLSSLSADPTETPTLKSLALHHGADTPQEQEKFYGWMKKLNGERLEKAKQAAVKERSSLLESKPEALQRWLKQVDEKPETIPLDTTVHTLVVPDAHFFPSVSGRQDLLIDRSDLQSIKGWREGDFRGQWFFLEGKTNLLIRDSALALDTPVHELGHVIDMTLEKDEPDFYRALKPRIEKAHYQARLHGKTISSYAMANRREYIAEGFASYYNEPGKLREVDPVLFGLVDEMVEFCCAKAGADRTLDRALQKMWKDAAQTSPSTLDPAALRTEFEDQVCKTPDVEGLSRTAMITALNASRLGLLAGAADATLGLNQVAAPPLDALADPIQQAYREGLDASSQRSLFALGYRHGLTL